MTVIHSDCSGVIPFERWMELIVQVGKVEETPHIRVPFSVTSKKLVVVGLV